MLTSLYIFLRKEVIQPHLPIRLPCYDFTPVIGLTLGSALLAVRQPTSGTPTPYFVNRVFDGTATLHKVFAKKQNPLRMEEGIGYTL